MSHSNFRVGTIGFPVNKKKLFPHVDQVEIMDTHLSLPKPATAAKWRDAAPGHVTFSMQVPRYLFETPVEQVLLPGKLDGYGGFRTSEENVMLFERTLRVAEALQAEALVLPTPVAFTPTTGNRSALRRFLGAVPSSGIRIVWQPSGPWEHEHATEFAKELGLILAVDPLRDDPISGEVAYFRLGPFAAMGSRVGIYDLERILGAAEGFSWTTVLFGTPRALDDARNLKKVIGESQ